MFANLNDVKNYCDFILNKAQSGSMNGNEFSLCINVAQQSYLRVKLGLPETFTVDKREAPQQFQTTIENASSLLPFTVSAQIPKSGSGFPLPSNYAAWANTDYLYAIYVDGQNQTTRQSIEFVNLAERGNRLNNYVLQPTAEYPIATYINGQLNIEPNTVSVVELIYVRYPITPVWGFTVNANDQEVYNPATSVQLEFPNMDWQNIANLAIKYCAMFLRDGEIYQAIVQQIDAGK